MAISINHSAAKKLLEDTLLTASFKDDEIGKDIELILRGTHKTYRYVLITGILAKATEESADALSIQAQDTSDGAYDARSLCHSVIVPFERQYLPESLGGSNEPYLNKPARFPRISLDNAVRSGNDRDTLVRLKTTLERIDSQEKAKIYLSSALATLKSIFLEIESKYSVDQELGSSNYTSQGILDYTLRLLANSQEGETCAILVGTIEQLANPAFKVVAHKVNESGASSKEVGDIDVFDGDTLVNSIEVKDKNFTKEDLEHAIKKFMAAGLTRTMFVYGHNTLFDKAEVYEQAAKYGEKGCYCCLIRIDEFIKLKLLSLPPTIGIGEFAQSLLDMARAINAKDETVEWIKTNLPDK